MSARLEPVGARDGSALLAIHVGLGMTTGSGAAAEAAVVAWLNSEKVIGRKLVVADDIVGGGQLTVQRYSHVVELGYWVARAHQGRGHGTAIAAGLARVALRERGFARVFAKTSTSNPASIRVLEKIGMRREGVLRNHLAKDGVLFDEVVYGLLADELP